MIQTEKPDFRFDIKADHENAIYKCGEKGKFKITLLDSTGKAFIGANFICEITGDWGLSKRVDLTSAANAPSFVEATLNKPGFVLCSASYKPEGVQQPYKGMGGIGFDPLLIKSQCPEPDDFDTFWAKAREELAAVPMTVAMTPIEASGGKVECLDVKVECAGGAPVSGYLVKPIEAKPGNLPAYISFHGAGVGSSQKRIDFAEAGFLAMDINAHGIANGKPESFYKDLEEGCLKGYRTRDGNDPSKIYIRGMFLRVMRALEFLKSRPEWDGRNLIVDGASQGGAQALVAAALDPQVSFCVAFVPALCLNTGILYQQKGFHWFIQMKDGQLQMMDGQPVSQAAIDTVPYYDAAIFAKRINCPCMLSTGFIDPYCPPTSVYAAFNNIPVKDKRIINNVFCGHANLDENYVERTRACKEHLQ